MRPDSTRLSPRIRLVRGLSVATIAAVLALAATGDAEAQRRGGFGASKTNMGVQRPMVPRSVTTPRLGNNAIIGGKKYGGHNPGKIGNPGKISHPGKIANPGKGTKPGKDGGRKPPKGPVVVD
jgi:hypothetical protein